VGIGTTTPGGLVGIQSSATSFDALSIGNAAGGVNILYDQNLFGTGSIGLQVNKQIRIRNSSTQYIDLKPNGFLINWDGPTTQAAFTISRNTTNRLVMQDNIGLNNAFEFYGNGTSNYAFTNINNFGVGTSTPLARLDVAGANNGTSALFRVSSVSSFATTTRFIIDSSGNVGLGTTTPGARLSVEGSSLLGNSATAGYFTATTSKMHK
jgi:hypothetical protein